MGGPQGYEVASKWAKGPQQAMEPALHAQMLDLQDSRPLGTESIGFYSMYNLCELLELF